MTILIKQGLERPATIGDQASATMDYYTFGEDDETTAHAAALAQLVTDFPTGYRSMPLRSTGPLERIGVDAFRVPFHFSLSQQQVRPSEIDPSDPTNPALSTFNTTQTFNLVGGTVHITNSLAVVQTKTAPGWTAMDFKGAIGVEFSSDGSQVRVRGLDIFAPVCDLSFTTQFKNSVVTDSYIDDVIALTGRTNNATFKRRPAGSVLFKGARGTQRGMDYWEITFEFAYIANVTGKSVGDITGINKKGFEYLDVLYRPSATKTNGLDVMVPVQATVHKVYEDGEFDKLLIGVA